MSPNTEICESICVTSVMVGPFLNLCHDRDYTFAAFPMLAATRVCGSTCTVQRFVVPAGASPAPAKVVPAGKGCSREQAIERYREYLASRPGLQAKVRAELDGKTLVCYCKPKACHGDILAELFAACPHCGSTDLASGAKYRWCLACEAKLGPTKPLTGDETADERTAIQTEHLPVAGESLRRALPVVRASRPLVSSRRGGKMRIARSGSGPERF